MQMMWKIHKQDEFNSTQGIIMSPKLWKDLTVTEVR